MKLLDDLKGLDRLHSEQLALAKATLGLAKKQDLDALDDHCALRRSLARRVQAAHRRLAPEFARWEERLAALTPEQAKRARVLVQAVEDKGRRTLALDRESGGHLQKAKASLADDLQRLHTGQRLQKAYNSGGRGQTLAMQLSRTG